MAQQFGINVGFDTREIDLWRGRFDSLARGSFPRAQKWALDEVSKEAVLGFRKDAHRHIDRPKPWTLRGLKYRRANLAQVTAATPMFSEIYMLPEQSAVLKYLMGVRIRRPGDVGPTRTHIAVPSWRGLNKIGIREDKHGNLPGSTMARLRREARVDAHQGTPNARGSRHASSGVAGRSKKSGGTFLGEPVIRGQQRPLGFYARPAKIKRGGRMVTEGVPTLLIYMADQTRHRPILKEFWDTNARRAAAKIPEFFAAELLRKEEWLRQRQAGRI